MLSRFNNEVLSHGPSAVLPQNLNAEWIRIIQKMADDFLDTNFDLNECKDPRDIGDPVLMACVYEIAKYQDGKKTDYTSKEMMDRIIAYKDVNPDFVKILKQACIIRDSKKGWFKNIKEKLL
jgi:hypothetical protein